MRSSPLKFLVVEDEVILAMDIEGMIHEAGHTVIAEAASLSDVEKLEDRSRPDVALVDVQLGRGSSGIDVSRLIHERWSNVVVVFVTANPAKIPADFAGAHGVIAKPFSQSSFLAAISYVAEGLQHPPPHTSRPAGFVPSPDIQRAWSC